MADLSALLDAARNGDSTARERLLREAYPAVEAMVHRALGGEFRQRYRWMVPLFSTGDIVQEVFLAVIQTEPERGANDQRQLFAWLATQVKCRIIDRVRFHFAQRRDVRLAAPLASTHADGVIGGQDRTPSVLAVLDERAELVTQALADLDERDRELWRLRIEQECDFATITKRLCFASVEAARSAFRRVQARLALRLHRLGLHGLGEASRP